MSESQSAGTKILATVGPACDTPEMLESLIRAGVDGFRINFAHGTHEEYAGVVDRVRGASERVGEPVALLGDLCGPKLRLLDLENGAVCLQKGQSILLMSGEGTGTAEKLYINHYDWLETIRPGHPVLIDDGRIRLRCIGVSDAGIECEVEFGGSLRSRDGVNLPETRLQTESLTEKDRADTEWAAEHGLDYLALSFVCQAEDVQRLRTVVRAQGSDAQIIAKIETSWAVRNLDSIIAAADGTLIARGDLGVEVDVESVPRLQKQITEQSRNAGKPVIIATQMLHSMVSTATPTRSEVNDIANTIYDGVDGLLLTNETAVGQYPLEAIGILERIVSVTDPSGRYGAMPVEEAVTHQDVHASLAMDACTVMEDVGAVALVAWTDTGELARQLSRYRQSIPVLALTDSPGIQRRMSLYYGVRPICTDRPPSAAECIHLVDRIASGTGTGQPGDSIVLILEPGSYAGNEAGEIIVHTLGTPVG